MYENFYKLSKDKQKQILDGAMVEFSSYGYKKTSIAQIAKAGNISKSMVFHYFNTKEDLFNFLVIYTCDYFKRAIDDFLTDLEKLDYIERYSLSAKKKLERFNENNSLVRFSGAILYTESGGNLSKEAKEKLDYIKKLSNEYESLLHKEKKDTKLRRDMPKEMSLRYIKWIIDGFTQEIIKKIHMENIADVNFDKNWEEFDYLLEDLKKLFYQGGSRNDK